MGFKDLFINSDDNTNDKPKKTEAVKESAKTKFPTQETNTNAESSDSSFSFGFGKSTPSFTPITNQVSQEHLDKAVEVYRNGFDSLNQDGYDFYEYYQAIQSAGADNAQVYPMAFAMAKSMDKSLSKDKLIQQSEFYVSEITKQYNNYIASGNAKRQQLLDNKGHENQSLSSDLDLMKQQMEQLKIQIQDRENKLKSVDSKYAPQLSEIDSKLKANEMAKNQLLESIDKVKTGIINNLK